MFIEVDITEADQIQIDLDSVTAGPHINGDIIEGFGEINMTVWGCDESEQYTYDWTYELDSEFNANTEDISGLFAGNYTLVVTDSNGESNTISITSPSSSLLTPAI